jgi:hypothetical protein
MKHVLLWLCLTAAAFSAPTPLDLSRASNLECDVAAAIPSTLSTEMGVIQSDQHEVHAVVVDMPQRASLAHASPETWDTLPMSDPPYEQAPATTVLQVAMH